MDVNVHGVVVPLPGGRRRDGARRARARSSTSARSTGSSRPTRALYDFRREAGEAFFKPVAYSVSKSALLNLTRYLATYWARSGVRVNTLTLAGIANDQPREFVEAYAARSPLGRLMDDARGGRRRRLPRLGRLVVRHRREPRRRRRLVGLVIPAEVPNLIAGEERPPASGAWLEKTRPADGARLCRVARSGAADVDAAVAAARRGAAGVGGAHGRRARRRRARDRARSCASGARRSQRVVAAETGKSIELARGETDAAIEMGFFVAGEGRRSYGRTTTASDAAPHRADRAAAGRRRRRCSISFNTPLPNVAWKAFPSIFCGNGSVLKPSEHAPVSA